MRSLKKDVKQPAMGNSAAFYAPATVFELNNDEFIIT